MNPSASGWINKLLKNIKANTLFQNFSKEVFYNELRSSGFIYGSNQNIAANVIPKTHLTEEEICKINLCLALYNIYKNSKCEVSFTESTVNFYTKINEIKTSYFKELLGDKRTSEQLEKIIHKRIQLDANVLTKNFNYFIINALLYIDVLAYNTYLNNVSFSLGSSKKLEASIITIAIDLLNLKKTKNTYDSGLIKLLQSSLRYQQTEIFNYSKVIKQISSNLERFYILDMACMSSWTDQKIDRNEYHFLKKLGKDLSLTPTNTQLSIKSINQFYTVNRAHIALLSSKNVIQSFYTNSSKMVIKLISRNSKRIYQELKDSKELMVLLSQSTIRDLSKVEQQKVQEQLLDIFKSIPSLAIFLLPGGAILLPLVIKFIPKLLPSAFDENRIDD